MGECNKVLGPQIERTSSFRITVDTSKAGLLQGLGEPTTSPASLVTLTPHEA